MVSPASACAKRDNVECRCPPFPPVPRGVYQLRKRSCLLFTASLPTAAGAWSASSNSIEGKANWKALGPGRRRAVCKPEFRIAHLLTPEGFQRRLARLLSQTTTSLRRRITAGDTQYEPTATWSFSPPDPASLNILGKLKTRTTGVFENENGIGIPDI